MPRWTREHEAKRQAILALLTREAKPFEDGSKEAVAARKALSFFDWCKVYLPHYFTSEPSPLHRTAYEAAEETGIPVGQLWSRGFGKSTIFTVARTLHKLLNRKWHFVIVGARSEDVAASHMDFIALELKENPRIRADYGEGACRIEGSAEDFVAHRTRVWARGIGQSPRGQRFRQYRPDAFVGDDLEDDVIARNPDRVKDLWDWLFGSIFPALEGAGVSAHFTLLYTMYGRGCLAVRVAEMATRKDERGRPLARALTFPAEDERGESAWAARYTTAQLHRAAAIVGARLYRREYLCKEDDEEASFRPAWFNDFRVAAVRREGLIVAAYCDPSARSAEMRDFKVWVVLGIPIPDGPRRNLDAPIYCLHAWIRHCSAGEMLDHAFWIQEMFGPGVLACEVNGFQVLLWPMLEHEEARRGRRLIFRPVTNLSSKEDRILSNQPEFERGLCHFDVLEGDQKILVDQFLDYGKTGVHDDGPDAWDGARRLLPGGSGAEPFSYRGLKRERFEKVFV